MAVLMHLQNSHTLTKVHKNQPTANNFLFAQDILPEQMKWNGL